MGVSVWATLTSSCAEDDLLEGLELAIKSMCRGEHSLFHVDPSYAYGRAGCPDLGIAADAALDYDVHLLSFEVGEQCCLCLSRT